jgi:hypothetical protein
MCTISVIPLRAPAVGGGGGVSSSGFRIVCNRDEDRRRVAAASPKWRAIERPGVPGARAIWPMDMEAGGTWIAAAEHGLAMCLLNLNPEPAIDLRGVRGLRSRGLIIPDLIGASSAGEAMNRLERQRLERYAPFRLVTIDGRSAELSIVEAVWNRRELTVKHSGGGPVCFASSGLGDSLVRPRLHLFRELVIDGDGETQDRQDEFHRHQWPDRTEISVLMTRELARTVSITTVEAVPNGRGLWDVAMDYEAIRADVGVSRASAAR